jgi:hypothetical protein
MYRKAKAAGVIEKRDSGRTFLQSIKFHFVQFDSKCMPPTEPVHL